MSQTISATKTSPLIKTLILKIKCLWQVGEILGGQLAQFTDCWTAMGAPLSILKTIKGYAFLFNQKPPLCSLHPPIPPPLITPKSTNMSKTVSSLLTNCIILPATTSMGFLASMFSRLKPNGLVQPIVNLHSLNSFYSLKKFRLINHLHIPQFLQDGDFMFTIDLSNAYPHVIIQERLQPFLSFHYKGTTYSWHTLPFGLVSAPQAFSQLTNWIGSIAQKEGIRIVVYLDDSLIVNQKKETLLQHTERVLYLLHHLGWTINKNKSKLNPSQHWTFVGLTWNTITKEVSLPQDKCLNLKSFHAWLIQRSLWFLKIRQHLLGLSELCLIHSPSW